MSHQQFDVPVAFLIFNRPKPTEEVFARIREMKPSKLLIVADGPRLNRPEENSLCEQTRSVLSRIDWPCDLRTNLSEVNLGCKRRVSTGISWIFEQVEEAIILEDDCLPNLSFFKFCKELLDKYRNDSRIGLISGDNFLSNRRRTPNSYYFTKHTHIWGWATWRRAWKHYDVEMKQWPEIRDGGWLWDLFGGDENLVRYWGTQFERVYTGEIDTWDYQLTLSMWMQGFINIQSSVNQISNIGFGPDATHTTVLGPNANLPAEEMPFPLKHPSIVAIDRHLDFITDREVFSVDEVVKGLPHVNLPQPVIYKEKQSAGEEDLNLNGSFEALGESILSLLSILHFAELKDLHPPIPTQSNLEKVFSYKNSPNQKSANVTSKDITPSLKCVPSAATFNKYIEIREEHKKLLLNKYPTIQNDNVVAVHHSNDSNLNDEYYFKAIETVENALGQDVEYHLFANDMSRLASIMDKLGKKCVIHDDSAFTNWVALFSIRKAVLSDSTFSLSAAVFNKSFLVLPEGEQRISNSTEYTNRSSLFPGAIPIKSGY